MFAVYADRAEPRDPLSALVVGERPEPVVPPGWVAVRVRAASINHHDLWTLRGVGIATDAFPMILGCDAAGIDPQGREVVVHSVIGEGPDETLDPARTLLSEKHQGTFADMVAVPATNVVPKPAELSWAEAACLPTAWLTAYRMLVTRCARGGAAQCRAGARGVGCGHRGRRLRSCHRQRRRSAAARAAGGR